MNFLNITALKGKTYERIYVINGYKTTQQRNYSSLFFVFVAEPLRFLKGFENKFSDRFPFIRSDFFISAPLYY